MNRSSRTLHEICEKRAAVLKPSSKRYYFSKFLNSVIFSKATTVDYLKGSITTWEK